MLILQINKPRRKNGKGNNETRNHCQVSLFPKDMLSALMPLIVEETEHQPDTMYAKPIPVLFNSHNRWVH